MTKRRRRRTRRASRVPTIAAVPVIDETTAHGFDATAARAELHVEAQERAAELPVDPALQCRIDRAFAALDRATKRDVDVMPPRPSLAARFTAWRRRRRLRALTRRLDRALGPGDARIADRSSSALLAVVTERIARIATLADPSELAPTITLVERIADDYRAYLARLAPLRDSARAAVSSWRSKSAVAAGAGRGDLASAADERVRVWERREREAAAIVEACEASRRRLEDAIAQLCALAARTRDGRKPSPGS